jgi:two-component system sensor histidine kinase/response regulator
MPKQAQTSLSELEFIVNRSPAVVFLRQAAENWPVEFVSDNVQQFGYTPEDFIVRRVQYADIVHPDDLSRVTTEISQYSNEKGRTEFGQEYRVITRMGEARWIDDRTWIRRDANGTITHYQGIVLDITERKRAEEALRKSEERYRRLVENAPIGIISVDVEGQVIDINPRLLAILGSSLSEAMGDTNVLSHPPLVEAGIAADFRHCLESGEPIISERSYTSRWGKPAYLRIHLTPILNPDRSIAGVQAVAEDIAERKQAEQAIRQANMDLKARVDELAMLNFVTQTVTRMRDLKAILEIVAEAMTNLFDALGTIISLLDAEKTNIIVLAQRMREEVEGESVIGLALPTASTPALLRLIEQPESMIILQAQTNPLAEPIRDIMETWGVYCLLNVPLQIRGKVIGIISIATGQVGREFTPAEIRLAETVAGQIAGAIENARLFEEEQKAKQVAEHARLAAEEARLAAEEARLAAEAANVAKSEFLANMSHELRSPLNAILGFAQLMTRDRQATAEQRENLETIIQSGDHLLTLINDILEMSKIEAGRTTLFERDFDLHLFLNTLQDMFYLRARDKGLQLALDQGPGVPRYVRADESKLRQVLINLLSNAVKFTEEGGITLRVRYTPNAEFGTLDFEVEDSGIGIAPDDLERMFDPFVQTASGQEIEGGTGLGLAISQQFVHLMGGDISVTSELGQGSIFRFNIQVKPAEETDAPRAQEQPVGRVIGLEAGQPVYRLLVAEDRKANRDVLVELLMSLGSPPTGFEVRAVANGEEAVEMWESWEPHLIWMDMRMPVMDGHKATQQIRATDRGQDTVIVALTASAFEEDRIMALEEGCDDFVGKPFREAEIFGKLAKHLGVRFVCEGQDEQQQTTGHDQFQVALTRSELAEGLAALPAAWASELEQAVVLGNLKLIQSVIDRIEALDNPAPDVASTLANLARDFEHDEMLQLIRLAQELRKQESGQNTVDNRKRTRT